MRGGTLMALSGDGVPCLQGLEQQAVSTTSEAARHACRVVRATVPSLDLLPSHGPASVNPA